MCEVLSDSDCDLESVSSIHSHSAPVNPNGPPNSGRDLPVESDNCYMSCFDFIREDVRLMKYFLSPVEFNYHVDKMLSYIRKLKMRKRMYSSRMGNPEMSMYSDQLKSRVDGIREMRNGPRTLNNNCSINNIINTMNGEHSRLESSIRNLTLRNKSLHENRTYNQAPNKFQRLESTQLTTVTEENYTPGNTNNEKLLRGSQQEWQQVPPLENSHLPMSVSVSTNQQPKQPTGYSNVSVVSNSTLFNKSALNQISQKGKQFNGSQMSYMPLEPEQESATESYMVSVSHQLGSDVSYEDESEDQNVVKEPTPPPITTSKTKGRRSTESKKPATSKKDTPKREARIILTPVSAKPRSRANGKANKGPSYCVGRNSDVASKPKPRNRKQPASKLKNLQEDEVDVDTNLKQKNPGKPANKNASKGSEKKAPSRKKKATTNNKKDNAETNNKNMDSEVRVSFTNANDNARAKSDIDDIFGSLNNISKLNAVSPGALLNSVKKTTNGLSGRVTPPTGMLVEYMGSKHLNASINMARTNVSKPVNRKQLVKRVTKERKERNQVLESRTSNYGGETSKQIDRILAAATSRTVTTPTILKEVFRKNEKRHDSSGSNLSDDSSAESE